MSSNTIINAAPMTIMRGIKDNSIRRLPVEAEVLPTHLAKVYIYAQKGPTSPQLVVGNGRNQMYGDDTFDLRKSYTTHQTVLSNVLNSKGNAQMIERIVPDDAGPKSTLLLSLDVLPTSIKQYERLADGSYKLDTDGFNIEIPNSTIAGFKTKWVVSNASAFGQAAVTAGDQTDGTVQSMRYPVMEFQASSFGGIFNNSGLRIWAPNANSTNPANTGVMSSIKAYPFRMQAIRRANATSTPGIVVTEFAEPTFDFVLKPNAINPATDSRISLGDIFLNKYQNLSDARFPFKEGDFGAIKMYQANIDKLVTDFFTAEKPVAINDFSGTDEQYMFNFISGLDSHGAPYKTFVMADTSSLRLTENTNLYAAGGSDGTMNDDLFAQIVAARVAEYGNPNSYLMDTAVYPESIMYDTGFPLATKYAMCKFIAERKDTAIILSTYDVNGQELSAADEHALAVALKARLQMYPESDYYGTACARGMIIGRYGDLLNSQFNKKFPLVLELASKAAEMMGAGDGVWKQEFLFDRAPNNAVKLFANANVTFTPSSVRNKDWEVGLNWVQSTTRRTMFFPALKTVYDNDTSVLNSFFTMMGCIELQKVGERVWREFTGNTSLNSAQLMDAVNTSVDNRTIGRFAGLFKIVPAAFMSEEDVARGYSWELPIKLYANGMSTVMALSVGAHRMSDLATA